MAVNYVIQAEVVDIRYDSPNANDAFLVDSNVWYWLTYTRASQSNRPPLPYQVKDYPTYIQRVLSADARLLRCGLSLAELAHRIEATEREIYQQAKQPANEVRSKEFRHNCHSERINVVCEVGAAWGQVKRMAQPIDLLVDEFTTNSAMSKLSCRSVDGYDLFILEAMNKAGLLQIITDDGDFATVPSLRVFTCNRNVITSARKQDMLLKR